MEYGAGCWESGVGKNVRKMKYAKIRIIKGWESNSYKECWWTSTLNILMSVSRSGFLLIWLNSTLQRWESFMKSWQRTLWDQNPREWLEQSKRAEVESHILCSQGTLSYDLECLSSLVTCYIVRWVWAFGPSTTGMDYGGGEGGIQEARDTLCPL